MNIAEKLGSDPDIPNRRYCKLGPGRIISEAKLGSDPDIPNRRYCKLGPSRIISGFKAGNTYIDARVKTEENWGQTPIFLRQELKELENKRGKLGSDPDIPNRRYCKLEENWWGKLGSDPIISYTVL